MWITMAWKNFLLISIAVYNAPNGEAALQELVTVREKWGGEEIPLYGP